MRGNSSRVSLALSATALFVALGGTAVAVTGQIGTKQIANAAVTNAKLHNNSVTATKLHNGAVTTSKLRNDAVSTSKLANNAVSTTKLADQSVTTSKIGDGAVTATQVAPFTFLAQDGTAVNAARLGGLLPADFVQGVGIMENRRVLVAQGQSLELLSTGFGTFTGNCIAPGTMTVTWSPTVSDAEYEATIVQFPSTVSISTANAIPAGGAMSDPSPASSGPMSINYQIGFASDNVATAYITGRIEGPNCVFIGQEVSSGS